MQLLVRLATRATLARHMQSIALLATPGTIAAMPPTSAWSAPQARTTPKGVRVSAPHAQAKLIHKRNRQFANFVSKGKQEFRWCNNLFHEVSSVERTAPLTRVSVTNFFSSHKASLRTCIFVLVSMPPKDTTTAKTGLARYALRVPFVTLTVVQRKIKSW